MRFLLDSHILLWSVAEPQRLSASVRSVLEDGDSEKLISAVSFAELRIKQRIGKLELPAMFEEVVLNAGFEPLVLTIAHARRLGDLELHHRDPFDRMLIAQAITEDLTLITADRQLQAYPVSLLVN